MRTDARSRPRAVARPIADVAALAGVPGRLLLVADFDGTLAEGSRDPGADDDRAARPARASTPGPRRRRPARPARGRDPDRPDRGRRRRAGPGRWDHYLGDHGLQSGTYPRGGRPRPRRDHVPCRPRRLARARRALAPRVPEVLGRPAWLFVERKGPSVAFHVRQADDRVAARRRGRGGDRRPSIRELPAARPRPLPRPAVVDLPAADGRRQARGASRSCSPSSGRRRSMAFGDDLSDADGFAVLREPRATPGRSAALRGRGHRVRTACPTRSAPRPISCSTRRTTRPGTSALASALERRRPGRRPRGRRAARPAGAPRSSRSGAARRAATAAPTTITAVTTQKPLASPPPIAVAASLIPKIPADRPDAGQDHRHAGQPLHDHRQVVVDLGQVDVERRRRQLAVVVELVGQADDVVVDVAEVDDLVRVDQRLVAVRQLVEHLADRADRAADLDELALELEQPLDGLRRRLPDDLVLDVVDRVADPVGEREVAVDQVVGDRPQQVVRTALEDRRRRRPQVVRRPADPSPRCGRSAGSRDPRTTSSSDATTVVAVGEVEQDDVDDAVGRLDLRALVALQDVLDDERVERRGRRRPAPPASASGPTSRPTPARRARRSELGQPASAPAPSLRWPRRPRRDDPDRARLAGRPDRRLAPDAARRAGRRSASEGERRVRGLAAIGVGASGGPGRVRRGRPIARRTRRLPRRPPRASAGGMATAVTAAATRNSPTMIEAASRDAQSSSAPTTSGSRSGRSRSASGMNWR